MKGADELGLVNTADSSSEVSYVSQTGYRGPQEVRVSGERVEVEDEGGIGVFQRCQGKKRKRNTFH